MNNWIILIVGVFIGANLGLVIATLLIIGRADK
jgi:hypothetical protein